MTTIYVGNLPFSATETDVRGLFEKHGAVQSVKLVNDRETGRPRGFGFVEMSPTRRADRHSAHERLRHGRPPAARERSSRARSAPAASERPLVTLAAPPRLATGRRLAATPVASASPQARLALPSLGPLARLPPRSRYLRGSVDAARKADLASSPLVARGRCRPVAASGCATQPCRRRPAPLDQALAARASLRRESRTRCLSPSRGDTAVLRPAPRHDRRRGVAGRRLVHGNPRAAAAGARRSCTPRTSIPASSEYADERVDGFRSEAGRRAATSTTRSS